MPGVKKRHRVVVRKDRAGRSKVALDPLIHLAVARRLRAIAGHRIRKQYRVAEHYHYACPYPDRPQQHGEYSGGHTLVALGRTPNFPDHADQMLELRPSA